MAFCSCCIGLFAVVFPENYLGVAAVANLVAFGPLTVTAMLAIWGRFAKKPAVMCPLIFYLVSCLGGIGCSAVRGCEILRSRLIKEYEICAVRERELLSMGIKCIVIFLSIRLRYDPMSCTPGKNEITLLTAQN
jgi:hypothetical protein